MNQRVLAVMDRDEEYASALAAYTRSGHFAGMFRLRCFTSREAFEQFLHTPDALHSLLLVHEQDAGEMDWKRLGRTPLILVEQPPQGQDEGGIRKVFKYQPLNRLFADLAAGEPEIREGGEPVPGGRTAKVISVFSPSGGSGKTAVALNLSRLLARQGSRVLLLSLEGVHSLEPILPSSGTDRFGQLLYYLKARPDQWMSRIDPCICQESATQIYYLEPPANPQDMQELTEAEAAALVEGLAAAGFDRVVVDLESSLHSRIRGALKASDTVLWLLLDDISCAAKNRRLLRELKRYEGAEYPLSDGKIRFCLNKFTGNPPACFGEDLSIDACLPYIPEWKTASSHQIFLSSPIFTGKLAELAKSCGIPGR
jgi:cellulose biosynthesis protein BcsQ